MVKLGSELRSYHLLENPKVYEIVISLNESENNTIERKIAKKDVEIEGEFVKLWLNDEQYIDKIPLVAWEFYIGGYQPAQKWLKDRAGREMREEDYEHYNKIIVALGHSDATSDLAIAATNAGATVVTHLFNAMRPLHHRESGLADVALTDSRLNVEVIADGKHVGDLSIALAHTAKKRQFLAMTDAMSAAGMPDGQYTLGGLTVTCADDVAVIAGTKTLAGSTLNMERVFDRLLNVYKFDLLDATWATATAPAKALELDSVGSIAVGKKCNFIVWKDGIHSVYKNGNLVHQN
mgnify:CR=1 FL=1